MTLYCGQSEILLTSNLSWNVSTELSLNCQVQKVGVRIVKFKDLVNSFSHEINPHLTLNLNNLDDYIKLENSREHLRTRASHLKHYAGMILYFSHFQQIPQKDQTKRCASHQTTV